MNTNTVFYTIVRNSSNTVIFSTDNYYHYVDFVLKHFPKTSYEYNNILEMLELKSKNFTLSIHGIDENYIE
jgi:uncharacterized protein YozE (UPF0346 family)